MEWEILEGIFCSGDECMKMQQNWGGKGVDGLGVRMAGVGIV